MGLAPDELRRAFEPFWRAADATRSETPGTGIGLALVKEYARVMGGTLDATSSPGEGSTFSMGLPLVD